jgi:hypothetical protein
VDSILEALGVELPEEAWDDPSAQADLALEAIAALKLAQPQLALSLTQPPAHANPAPIPPGHRDNFNTLLRAAADGALALLSCLDATTGEPRYVICAVAYDGKEYQMTPFGHLCNGNPYEEYVPTIERH